MTEGKRLPPIVKVLSVTDCHHQHINILPLCVETEIEGDREVEATSHCKGSLSDWLTGPRSAVGNVSGYRCVSDCRSRGREFDPGPVPYFRGD